VTDGRTDRQTDRILFAIPRLHYMQRGKNYEDHRKTIKDLLHMIKHATVGCEL